MRADSPGLLILVIGLVVLAGVLSSADAALASFSRARAEELTHDRRPGARRLLDVLDDPAPVLNTVLFARSLCETAAVVVITLMITGSYGRSATAIVVAVAVMVVISFVAVGVGPRTLGRQHSERIALVAAGPMLLLSRVLGPVPRLLILLGNALTPGRGFSAGPFASEAELREMVDLAEASSVIESGEREMIHSVFELGDTSVREVMVPRTDVVYIERHKTLRQAMSLFLRTGYSRVPVVGEDLDDIVGFAYLKDISRRVFDRQDAQSTEHVDTLMRPVLHVPDSKPVDDLLREMQAARRHIAVVVDEYGGTAGLVTIEDVLEEIVGEITDEFDPDEVPVESLPDGSTRVSSRFPVDDLDEVVGITLDEETVEDVDSVGGLMAKHLGKVPIPGSVVEVGGLIFEAEGTTGRRKRIGTVLITPLPTSRSDHADHADHAGHTGTLPDRTSLDSPA
ncbi:hemolysin family protein [Nocardioides terrisoli]|uniref:hemolysin family protein n=1 Tax=Nocardioides terrisoli TaxID=3388267 RepID=UPI00287BB3A7|nr:hemolysin family protein [Nocardioides marmorisolisilvae]